MFGCNMESDRRPHLGLAQVLCDSLNDIVKIG
jgi:hypothetical protein